jgi:hypothetical protein
VIPNPWVILAILATWLGTLVGAYVYGDHVGTVTDKAAWQGQQITELKTAKAEIERLNAAARAKEATQAAQLAVNGADYEKRLQDSEDQRRADVSAARSGRIVLRVPGLCPAGNPAPADPAPASVSHGPADGRLPDQVTSDLLELADAADRNTEQLAACQAVVQTYTKAAP